MFDYAVILAAGKGDRMMPLTSSIPKAMIKIEGKPLISYSLRQIRGRVRNIAVTVGSKNSDLVAHVAAEGATAIYNTSGHGNSWWLFNTPISHLNEAVVVMPCDNLVHIDLHYLYMNYLMLGSPACMLVPVKPVSGIEGDYISHRNGMVSELSRVYPAECYCSGIQVVNPFLIGKLSDPEENFDAVWHSLIRQGALFCSGIYPHKWYSVNSVEQLQVSIEKKIYLDAIA